MRYFYDTEFLENGKTIELISIGIVAEDGREYYAVNRDAPWRRIKRHEWLMANVVPYLPRGGGDWRNQMPRRWLVDFYDPRVKRRARIAQEVRDFLLGGEWEERADPPELWAWYGAYDHVALAQLWGTMVDLPRGIPMWTNDVQQEAHARGNPTLPEQEGRAHDALADARHVRNVWEWLFRTEAA